MMKRVISLILLLWLGQLSLYAGTHDQTDLIGSELIAKDSEYKLIFFGYAGCYHFCDPRLRLIDPIYKELKKSLDISMLFIDISQESSVDAARKFVKDVNSEFEAIHPTQNQMKALHKEFKDLFIQKMPDGEYLHSGFLYLLQRHEGNYYLKKIFLEFYDDKKVIESIKKVLSK